MSEDEHVEDPQLSSAEQARLQVKYAAEFLEMGFNGEGKPMLMPTEGDELAGLMIGIATSPEVARWNRRRNAPG